MTRAVIGKIKCGRTFRKSSILVSVLLITLSSWAQKIATLTLTLENAPVGLDIPVQVDLSTLTHLTDSSITITEIRGKERIPVSFQIEDGKERKLTWMVSDKLKTRRYEVAGATGMVKENAHSIQALKNDGALTLGAGSRNLLRYHYQEVYPPVGIDTVFKRSAFIHPLWSPHGQELTRIQAPDHYHHYGIWNPWTHVLYEGDTIDFWNLNGQKGTVRFADFVSIITGNVFGEYAALHEHVVLKGKKEKVALNELQTVRIYVPENNKDYYIADITVQLNCTSSPVRLLEYRYGGMGWRATGQWTKDNSSVLSSEGKTRKNADGSKARWCIVQGTVDKENAGVVMMSYPVNYNHPEPLRIWPEDIYNRGDMFANFATTKDTDWLLEPGKNYVLRYRFIVFNGNYSKEKAETAWQYFAKPPVVTVVKE